MPFYEMSKRPLALRKLVNVYLRHSIRKKFPQRRKSFLDTKREEIIEIIILEIQTVKNFALMTKT